MRSHFIQCREGRQVSQKLSQSQMLRKGCPGHRSFTGKRNGTEGVVSDPNGEGENMWLSTIPRVAIFQLCPGKSECIRYFSRATELLCKYFEICIAVLVIVSSTPNNRVDGAFVYPPECIYVLWSRILTHNLGKKK